MTDSRPLTDDLRELAENWATLPVDEDGWPLAAAHIRQSYGAGYMAGLAKRLDAEPESEVGSPGDTASGVGGAGLVQPLVADPVDPSRLVDRGSA